ncbi:PucR family transcriptional regulator [Blastococcus saxobsidens]|uniref:Purine catabolism regulator n=1 Tax=Blastococcus saxobsidens TaxID=138336 RepID=A0A4Q7Y2Y5_9ACTN|nr:PucR family transcriptional regulator [Blastococcus saxobsidens]RZU30431.1 purine catabolism regulator [Blastococcus saxobsidens]
MSITIEALVALPALRTRFLAGRSGKGRAVLWAHTCELPDPWNWLGTGDLLLSDGYNFPVDAEGQVQFLENLAQAALSGLALAEGMHAPALTAEAMATADALGFPVLETAYAVPFVTVARTVADSNSQEASARLTKIIRLYDALRRAHQANFRGEALLDQLGSEAGVDLHVIDVNTGEPLLPTREALGAPVREALLETIACRSRPLPTFIRVTVADETVLALPVQAGERAVLVIEASPSGTVPDLVVLQHVATIADLEVERRAAGALRRREAGARLLAQLVDGSIDVEGAESRLSALGLGRRPWRVVCASSTEGPMTLERAQAPLTAAGVPHLLLESHDEVLALLADEHTTPDIFGAPRDPRFRGGVSQPVHSLRAVGDAARQARWALEAARSEQSTVVVYGEQSPTFMPRTVAEGEAVVARVLGPVIAYDADNDSRLVQSLEVFLDCNRSWKEGADRLGIHRQTLVYRMHRIEELTGRKLQNLQDQTDLYLALKTLQMLRGTGARP